MELDEDGVPVRRAVTNQFGNKKLSGAGVSK